MTESVMNMTRRERIKNRLFNKEYLTKQEWWGDNETILTSEEVKQQPLIVRKALAIKHVAENMPIEDNSEKEGIIPL